MALTTEQLVLQADILASKTDSTTNPNMTYKTTGVLNKGLNPAFFTSNNTKIVNAINLLAGNANTAIDTATNVLNKVNVILLDTSTTDGSAIWEETKVAMGNSTIIEGLNDLFSGKKQQQILNLNESDIGKFLAIEKDDEGNLCAKATDASSLNQSINASNVVYENPDRPEFTTVYSVLSYLLENQGTGNEGSGGAVINSIEWENVLNKPSIVSGLTITDDKVCLQAGDEVVASIDLVTDAEIDAIITALN